MQSFVTYTYNVQCYYCMRVACQYKDWDEFEQKNLHMHDIE